MIEASGRSPTAGNTCRRRTRSCRDITLPDKTRKRVVPLSPDEVQRLADAAPDYLRGLVLFMAMSGLRVSEALGLTRDRVDFLGKTVSVERQLVYIPGSPPQFGPPKTAASVRVVPVPESAIFVLSRHLEAFPAEPEDLIFRRLDGQPILRTTLAQAFKRMAKKAGLLASTTSHDMRHSYASLLIRGGASVKVVQASLGHATAQETLDTYSHLWPDDDERTRTIIEAGFAGTLGGPWETEQAADQRG